MADENICAVCLTEKHLNSGEKYDILKKGRLIKDNIITLHNEFGEDVHFEFLDLVMYKDAEYVVLLPVGDDKEVGEVVILQLETCDEETDEEPYIGVDDELVLTEVYGIFIERHKDEYDVM